jgi:predicted hotdog family 3-hydroxylacyl-ACP dehydratase
MIIKVMKERGKNPPRSIQLIIPHKIRMIPLERIKQKRLVRLGDMQIRKTAFVRQVQLPASAKKEKKKKKSWL